VPHDPPFYLPWLVSGFGNAIHEPLVEFRYRATQRNTVEVKLPTLPEALQYPKSKVHCALAEKRSNAERTTYRHRIKPPPSLIKQNGQQHQLARLVWPLLHGAAAARCLLHFHLSQHVVGFTTFAASVQKLNSEGLSFNSREGGIPDLTAENLEF